MVANHNMVKRA